MQAKTPDRPPPISQTRKVRAGVAEGRKSISRRDRTEGARNAPGMSGSSRLETVARTSGYGLSSSSRSAMISPLRMKRQTRQSTAAAQTK